MPILGKKAPEATRGAVFAKIPRFCKLIIIVRVSSIMTG